MKKIVLISLCFLTLLTTIFLIGSSDSITEPNYYNLSRAEVEEKISLNKPFFLYVYQTSCSTCIEIRTNLNNATEEMDVELFALNVETDGNFNSEFFERYSLESTPTLVYFNEAEFYLLEGYKTKDEIIEFYKNMIGV